MSDKDMSNKDRLNRLSLPVSNIHNPVLSKSMSEQDKASNVNKTIEENSNVYFILFIVFVSLFAVVSIMFIFTQVKLHRIHAYKTSSSSRGMDISDRR